MKYQLCTKDKHIIYIQRHLLDFFYEYKPFILLNDIMSLVPFILYSDYTKNELLCLFSIMNFINNNNHLDYFNNLYGTFIYYSCNFVYNINFNYLWHIMLRDLQFASNTDHTKKIEPSIMHIRKVFGAFAHSCGYPFFS
jgi:hypothetical protein